MEPPTQRCPPSKPQSWVTTRPMILNARAIYGLADSSPYYGGSCMCDGTTVQRQPSWTYSGKNHAIQHAHMAHGTSHWPICGRPSHACSWLIHHCWTHHWKTKMKFCPPRTKMKFCPPRTLAQVQHPPITNCMEQPTSRKTSWPITRHLSFQGQVPTTRMAIQSEPSKQEFTGLEHLCSTWPSRSGTMAICTRLCSLIPLE